MKIKIRILTPEKVLYQGDAASVLLPGSCGEFHIFANHAAVISPLKQGDIRVLNDDKSQVFHCKISDGTIEYSNNQANILCEI